MTSKRAGWVKDHYWRVAAQAARWARDAMRLGVGGVSSGDLKASLLRLYDALLALPGMRNEGKDIGKAWKRQINSLKKAIDKAMKHL